jgi:hypothetical protein
LQRFLTKADQGDGGIAQPSCAKVTANGSEPSNIRPVQDLSRPPRG